jgi:hypothetical protein
MHRSMKQLLAAAALTGAAIAAPAVAAAETNPYTGQEVCGSSYGLYENHTVWSNDHKVQLGQLQVLFSAWEGKSCAVMLKTRRVGEATFTSVSLARKQKNLDWKSDDGSFSYYAGPVYVKGPCARAGGYMHMPSGREGIFVEPGFPAGC